jgi:hypothetical protein
VGGHPPPRPPGFWVPEGQSAGWKGTVYWILGRRSFHVINDQADFMLFKVFVFFKFMFWVVCVGWCVCVCVSLWFCCGLAQAWIYDCANVFSPWRVRPMRSLQMDVCSEALGRHWPRLGASCAPSCSCGLAVLGGVKDCPCSFKSFSIMMFFKIQCLWKVNIYIWIYILCYVEAWLHKA